MTSSVFRRISTADTNAAVVSATPVVVTGLLVSNVNAAVRYLKLYNMATAPAQTDTPAMTILLPAVGSPQPTPIALPPTQFTVGLGMRLVTGIADNDNTGVAATEQIVHILLHGE